MQFTSRSLDTAADLNSAMAAIEKTSDPEKGSAVARLKIHTECLNTLLDGILIAWHLLHLR